MKKIKKNKITKKTKLDKIPTAKKAIEEAIRTTHKWNYDKNFRHFEFSVEYDGEIFTDYIHADEGIDSVEAFKKNDEENYCGEKINRAVENIKRLIKDAIINQEVAQIIIN